MWWSPAESNIVYVENKFHIFCSNLKKKKTTTNTIFTDKMILLLEQNEPKCRNT